MVTSARFWLFMYGKAPCVLLLANTSVPLEVSVKDELPKLSWLSTKSSPAALVTSYLPGG